MKLKRFIQFSLIAAGLQLSSAAAAEIADNFECEFKAIYPEGADFFTSGFRAYPVVGTKFTMDFNAEIIRSIVFDDGQVFFSEGEATLSRLSRFGTNSGYGGVRQGNQGFYIGYIAPVSQSQADPGLYTSRFALTNAWRGENFHLQTEETHYGDLECRRTAGESRGQ